ncbi:MAG: alpha/beta fold hydrolase [Actinobacteria bacterium]|nr:alpha/beta fold hydrolase [Actinomycetota bacterium]MBU1944413.1 alpha/beta fold hydrolase [Actinomycetota bacterium]MBU2688199.1 alpha/beta fold hydrolase [Actinomycetota bacterium]
MGKTLPALIALALLACLAGCSGTTPSATTTKETYKPTFKAPASQTGLVFQSPELQFQMLRAMGASAYGAADIGECLQTAMQVDETQLSVGNFDSWYDAWNSTAQRLRGIADGSLAAGDRISARDTYLRCNTYYNMAEFYLHGNPADPRIAEASTNARDCFLQAGRLMDPPLESIEIEYEGTALPAYFFRVDDSGKKRPLLMVQTGFDGTKEELYSGCAIAALERGYNVLAFEGPGQGEVLRVQGLHFRPDWEKVVTPVVDYAIGRKEVDPKKISLWGISMGGCLAARAAAHEPRLAALILDPAMDMSVVVMKSFGPLMAEMSGDPSFQVTRKSVKEAIEKDPKAMDEAFGYAMKGNVSLTWFVQNGMYAFGLDSPSAFPLTLLDYSLAGVSDKIKCETLVCDAEQDVQKYGSMTKDIYESLTCPKEYVLFTNAEGAGAHCQMGATRFGDQVKLDWLDATI